MAELKSKSKPPPEVLKRSERLKSRKRKKDVPTSPAYTETKDTQDEEPADKKSSSKSELSDEAKSPNTKDSGTKAAASGRKSPEPNCAICLSKLENKSFTDSCFHMFCFVCLQEWSKIKPECPLCKQPFKSIIHNVRSYEDYDQYHLERQERSQATWDNPDGRRFRYRTTVTQEHIYSLRHYADLLQRPSAHGSRAQMLSQVTTRQNWRRQRQVATSEFRSRIYRNGLRVKDVADANGRQRDISPAFFAANPAAIHRLIPWLNRELNALLQNHQQHVQFLIELITGLIKRFDIESEEFFQHLYPFIGRHTRHFMYEFKSFAKSPFSMTVYDTKARYEQQTHSVSDSETEESDGNDSDVMIVSPSASTGAIGAHTVVPSRSRHTQQFEPPAERRWFEIDVTPRTDNLRDLLEDNSFPGQSGWESPTPGPSGGSFLLDALTTQAEDHGNNSSKTDRKKRKVMGAKVKVEEETETGHVINSGSDSDDSSSSDVIFVGFDRPWQERSPLLISSDEESGKDDKKPKCEVDKHPKTKTSEQSKSVAKRPRNESYSSDERYSSVSSSYSRHRSLHSSSRHRKGRYRSPSYTRSKEDRPDSYSRYQHKKFSQKKRRHRSSRSSSAGELDDYRHSRRSVSTTSKSSRHSTKRDRSYHDRYFWGKSPLRSHSRSPSYSRKRDDHRKDGHRSHTSQCRSRELTSGSKDYHSRHKKHKKHKHKSRHDKQKSHKQKERQSKDSEKHYPYQSHLALSDSSKDGQYEKEMNRMKHKPSGEQIRSKIVVPNREIEYSDVSDDSLSFSAQTRFKKHPSGHKKSRANVENHSPVPTSTTNRSLTSVRNCHESDQSDAALLPGEKSPKSSSVSESTKESDMDSRDAATPQHEVMDTLELHNEIGGSPQTEQDATASVSSDYSGGASLKTVANDVILPNCGQDNNTSDNKETDSVDVVEMPVSITNFDGVCSSVDVISTTQLHLNRNNNEFSNSNIFDTFGLTSNSFTDARLSLDQLFQTPNSENAEVETVTIDSSTDDDSICVSSSSVYVDTASFSDPQCSHVLDGSHVSILPRRGNSCVLPGSTSDKPCNIESDEQIEIHSDSEEDTVTVDFFQRNSRSAMDVKSKSRRKQQCEIVDSESETDSSPRSMQRGHVSDGSNSSSESSKDSETGQVRSSNALSEVDHVAVNRPSQKSTDVSDASSEDKPLDLSAQCEVTNSQEHTDDSSSVEQESDINQTNISVGEGTSEESSCDRYLSNQALDLRAKAKNSHVDVNCSEINSEPNARCCDHVDSASTVVSAGSTEVTVGSVVTKPLEQVPNCNSEHSNQSSCGLPVVNNCDEQSVRLNEADTVSSLEHDVAISSSVNTNLGLENSCEADEKSRGASKNMDPFLYGDQISNEIPNFVEKTTAHEYDCCDSSDTNGLNMVQDIPSESYHHTLLPEWCQDSLLSSSCADVVCPAETAESCSVVESSVGSVKNVYNACSSASSTNVTVLNDPNVELSSTCSFTNNSSSDSSCTSSVADSLSSDSSTFSAGNSESSVTVSVVNSLSESASPSTIVANNIGESPSAAGMTNGIIESPSTISIVNNTRCTSSSMLNDAVASSSSNKRNVVNCSLISNTSACLSVTHHSRESDEFQEPASQMIPDSQQQQPEVQQHDES